MLDVVMTAAAFDQKISLLLLDSAVFHIKKQQRPDNFGLKDTAATFKALPLYDIGTLYIETESLSELGLTPDNLDEPVIAIPRTKVGEFLNAFELVLSA